ncbi:hypothetical protein [Saccharicrinis sp. FJH54]|uniref:hypothetical protein n=1 Tax=Saccharicrinis sp. FJH54 TaxID=3344665 RepID=UPI0035D52056
MRLKPLQYSSIPFELRTNPFSNGLLDYNKYLNKPEIKFNNHDFLKDKTDLTMDHPVIYFMPCVKTDINSRMPVLKPDTITKYSLLIKKLQ